MRELVYYVASSLDGFIARADGSFDGFVHDDVLVADYLAELRRFGAVVMGRATYEVGLADGVTDPYPHLDSYVVSRTLRAPPDPKISLIADDVVARVRDLKRRPGDPIYLCGGGRLAATLLGAGLIDRVTVKLNPVLFGRGIPLFAAHDGVARLELEGRRDYPSGITVLEHRVAA